MVDFGCKSVQTSPIPHLAHSAPHLTPVVLDQKFYKVEPTVKSPRAPCESPRANCESPRAPYESPDHPQTPQSSTQSPQRVIDSPVETLDQMLNRPLVLDQPLERPQSVIDSPVETLDHMLNQPLVLEQPLEMPKLKWNQKTPRATFSEIDGILGLDGTTATTSKTINETPKVKFFVFDGLTAEKW